VQLCTSSQTITPTSHHSVFLQARCPSCRPTNSIKALIDFTWDVNICDVRSLGIVVLLMLTICFVLCLLAFTGICVNVNGFCFCITYLIRNACRATDMHCISTEFGVDSSSHFLSERRQTHKLTDGTDHPNQ